MNITKTYGRNRSKASAAAVMQDMTNKTFPTTTPATGISPSRKSTKRKSAATHESNDEHGGIENEFKNDPPSIEEAGTRMCHSASLSSMAEVNVAVPISAASRGTKAKRLNRLEDLVAAGFPEDIRMLVERMKAVEKSSGSSVPGQQNNNMARIYDDGTQKSEHYLTWMISLGFTEGIWGESVVYNILVERMRDLRAVLMQTEYWRVVVLKVKAEAKPAAAAPGPERARALSDLHDRMTPLINTDPAFLASATPSDALSLRAPTPSRILADAFQGMTFRGETPRSASASRETPTFAMSMAGSSDAAACRDDGPDAMDDEEDSGPHRAFDAAFAHVPSIMPRHDEHDEHDAEVRNIMIYKSESSSSGCGQGQGSDAGSSRCASHATGANMQHNSSVDDLGLLCAEFCPVHSPYAAAEQERLFARCSSVPNVLVNNVPMGVFSLNGSGASAFKSRSKEFRNRRITRSKRSNSEPVAPSFTPSSPANLSRTHTIGATTYATPTKYAYADTEGAMTHLLKKCANAMGTGESSAKRPTSRIFGCSTAELPPLSLPPGDDAGPAPHLFSTFPLPAPATLRRDSGELVDTADADSFLSFSRQALESRKNSDLVRVSSITIHDSSPIIACGEKMCVIPESGEESADDSAMMIGLMAGPRDVRMSTLKKKRLSHSKKIRMSVRGEGGLKKTKRRSSIFSLKHSSRGVLSPAALSPVVRGNVLPMQLSENNFFPIVIGGVYQQQFEFSRPVVHESSAAFPRVMAIDMPLPLSPAACAAPSAAAAMAAVTRLRKWYLSTVRAPVYPAYESGGDLLTVTVLAPGAGAKPQEPISLGSAWTVVPAFPGGLLIVSTEYCCESDKRKMCFFIPDHFLRKELMCDVEQNEFGNFESFGAEEMRRTFSMGLEMEAASLNASQCTEATEADDMDIMDRYSSLGLDTSVLDSSVVSVVSDGSGTFHQHLLMHLDTGHGISPCVSVGAAHLAAASPMLASPVPGAGAGAQRRSISAGITPQGREYFENLLFNEKSPFLVCREHDLVNSGDIMELVLPFLAEAADDAAPAPAAPSEGGRSSRRGRGASRAGEPTGYSAVKLVSKRWAVSWIRCRSAQWALRQWDLRDAGVVAEQYARWVEYINRFQAGTAVGVGGAKTVFRMQRAGGGGGLVQRPCAAADAVAVMDVLSVQECAVQQELVVSAACSGLAKAGICPNVVQIHSTFQSPYPAPPMWQSVSSTSAIPGADGMQLGHYQYINMEFCAGGDIEDHIRKQRKRTLPVGDIRNIFFQMCFSIYSCREQMSLRHFDIKLLNFLLADSSVLIKSKGDAAGPAPRYEKVAYRIGFGESVYALQLSLAPAAPGLVKLADFGTSLIGQEEAARSSITAQQFTTLENTAPEFLFLGSAASSSSFAADTFGLGLSFLHLVTGHAPYEELLEQVRCPEALRAELHEIWACAAEDSPYAVIGEVLGSLDASMDMDDSAGGEEDDVLSVLYDTLYRYVVLAGLPAPDLFAAAGPGAGPDAVARNPVVVALLRTLDQGMNENVSEAVAEATMQYMADTALWNIYSGNHDIMKRYNTKHHM
jgi:hypothetical protein